MKLSFLKTKKMLLMFILCVSASVSHAFCMESHDGYSVINIKQAGVQEDPRTESILATIDGHVLAIVFTENLGQVNIDITTDSGATVNYNFMNTPNGVNYYIPNTGSYIVYFTFSDGDQYYGEFEVTD